MTEEWRWIAGQEGRYQVSDLGRVRSVPRPKTLGGILRPHVSAGYARVPLRSVDGRGYMALVHRLVLSAFAGECPDGYEAGHLNGNRLDNRLANLSWVSKAENEAHKAAHGTRLRGERTPSAKLTWSDVLDIRASYRRVKQTDLAKKYGVSRGAIQEIHTRRTWNAQR